MRDDTPFNHIHHRLKRHGELERQRGITAGATTRFDAGHPESFD
jgi:hypothetical protein